MIELVPMAYRVANELEDDEQRQSQQSQALPQSQHPQADPAAAAETGASAAPIPQQGGSTTNGRAYFEKEDVENVEPFGIELTV